MPWHYYFHWVVCGKVETGNLQHPAKHVREGDPALRDRHLRL